MRSWLALTRAIYHRVSQETRRHACGGAIWFCQRGAIANQSITVTGAYGRLPEDPRRPDVSRGVICWLADRSCETATVVADWRHGCSMTASRPRRAIT